MPDLLLTILLALLVVWAAAVLAVAWQADQEARRTPG